MKPLAIIKAGNTFPDLIEKYGDFEDWICRGLDRKKNEVQIFNAVLKQDLPAPELIKGAVISGSHDYVTQDSDWSLRLESWARQVIQKQIPLLGICYGHQILARAMGGMVDFHPKGIEIGTRDVNLLPDSETDPLFQGLPGRFKVHVFHSQSVIQTPPGSLLLAKNDFDPHQAFRIGKNAWGVQFHPEADASATRGYIRNLKDDINLSGQDPKLLTAQLEETPHAAAILKRFGVLAFNT